MILCLSVILHRLLRLLGRPLPAPDVAASTETPNSKKLNAATARAQTSAAVGAVSLVAVLSYFM